LILEFTQQVFCGWAAALIVFAQVRAYVVGIQKCFKFNGRQFLDLLFRIVDAAFVTDAGLDMPHDFFDVD
jgi:hypothetical protein